MAETMNNSIDRRFDILKQKAAQDVRAGQQEAQRGLTRQFARLGGIGTGAFVKQQQLAQEAGQKQLGEAQQAIEFQKLGEQQRLADIEEARKYQTAEREAGQKFASGERLGAQTFSAAQAELQRKFTTGERVAAQEFNRGLFDIEQANTREKLDLAAKQFDMENNVNFLNARLQIAEGLKKGLFGVDDLQALNSMFGIPTNQAQGPGLVTSQASSVNLNKIRDMFADLNSRPAIGMQGNMAKAIERKRIFDEASRLGIKPEELKRAGISGY
jgi:hypothetical protein